MFCRKSCYVLFLTDDTCSCLLSNFFSNCIIHVDLIFYCADCPSFYLFFFLFRLSKIGLELFYTCLYFLHHLCLLQCRWNSVWATEQFSVYFHGESCSTKADVASLSRPAFVACMINCFCRWLLFPPLCVIFAILWFGHAYCFLIMDQVVIYLWDILISWNFISLAFKFYWIHFHASIEELYTLKFNNILRLVNLHFQGCSLRNTEYIVGAVVFTGHETKVSCCEAFLWETRLQTFLSSLQDSCILKPYSK